MDKLKVWWKDLNPNAQKFFYILGGLVLIGLVLKVLV
jgi:hypothetical protein